MTIVCKCGKEIKTLLKQTLENQSSPANNGGRITIEPHEKKQKKQSEF